MSDDYLDNLREDKNNDSKNKPGAFKDKTSSDMGGFFYAAMKNLIKVSIWLIFGTNILFLARNYEPVNPAIYRKDIPYSMYKSNFLAAWFGKMMILTWSTYRSLTQKTIFNPIGDAVEDDADGIKKGAVIIFSPIFLIIGLFIVPLIGFVTTIFGSFRKGSEDCQQTWTGVIFGLFMLLFGILFIIANVVGFLQLIYFYSLIIIYPLLQEGGRDFLFRTLTEYKNLVTLFYGATLVYLSYKYLSIFTAIGMLISFIFIFMFTISSTTNSS